MSQVLCGRALFDRDPTTEIVVAVAIAPSSRWITIEVGDGQLRFEVGDDGCGIDEASRRAGSGLQNVRDRVEALSGTVTALRPDSAAMFDHPLA
jgi:glucose-6-phosphate-specific signal transduction histidine kinase